MTSNSLLVLAFFAFFSLQATAQDEQTVVVHKDDRIEQLLKKQGDINKLAIYKTSNGQFKGYSIMVLSTNKKDSAYQIKGQLLARFPEHRVYFWYQAPFYKIKIGDFIKAKDAEALRKKVSAMMRKDLSIIPSIITIKPEDEEKYYKEQEVKDN